ncbi:serine hydrolase domain-containing protein [Paracoccus tegillarcae]|uniref:6-aminohexanoate hydrolase n=1 Tax=Paracoccus tegillarcae TaxID=1529068 RepID=A0A2K9F237_9RHOB|nr:serine hydrolase [Paracoccus tegillarcae]AUH34432.1 6-aminohexanoate hydrolase [Paracoccus tegillarcae]
MHRRTLITAAALSPLLAAPSLAQDRLGRLLDEVEALDRIRAVAIWRDGAEIAARGYHGWTPDQPTNIKSASKSIISALAGIAVQRGALDGPDQPIAPILAADLPGDPDPRLSRITLGNLLSMQAGLERQSGANYGRWVSSGNWVRTALAAPFTQDPGGRMQYSTASSHLVSAVLTRVTGRSTLDLARDWLAPIPGFGITGWERDPQGIYLGGNQMAMSTRSLMNFGAVYAADGRANGQQIVPQDWIETSWQRRTASIFSGQGYGYGWFLTRIVGRDLRYGWGYGGQMIYVFPGGSRNAPLAIAMTSDPDQPSARTGYRDQLHRLAIGIAQAV